MPFLSKYAISNGNKHCLIRASPEKTVAEDVAFLKGYESLSENIDIVGLVLDTHTGLLKQVV